MRDLQQFIEERSKNYAGAIKGYVAEEMRDTVIFVLDEIRVELDERARHLAWNTEYGEGTKEGLESAHSILDRISKQVRELDK